MKIILSPDPTLRTVCEPVDIKDSSLKRISNQMSKLMYSNNGCGLAGPQVGILKRIVTLDCNVGDNQERNLQVLLNPEIIEHSDETIVCNEGCLSVPGVSFPISRYCYVKVRAYNLNGEEVLYEGGEDLLGRCLQHELDHLDGITMFERLDPIARIEALKTYKTALENGAKPGDIGA